MKSGWLKSFVAIVILSFAFTANAGWMDADQNFCFFQQLRLRGSTKMSSPLLRACSNSQSQWYSSAQSTQNRITVSWSGNLPYPSLLPVNSKTNNLYVICMVTNMLFQFYVYYAFNQCFQATSSLNPLMQRCGIALL